MKRISVSSLLICFVMTGSLYAQFDGQNGQTSFYTEVEEENRPDFLQMEEESMLIERWDNALSTLGFKNVSVLQEVQLEELQQEIRREQLELQKEIQQIVSLLDQLENRNEQLLSLHRSLCAELLSLGEELELIASMTEKDESEEDLIREDQSEINAIAATLDKHRQEISNNDLQAIDYQQMLMDRESDLQDVVAQVEAISFLTSNMQRIQQYRSYTLNTVVAP
ncbi:MAG: hypothetical protein AB8H47_24985 [Bacteroidia bacterium]